MSNEAAQLKAYRIPPAPVGVAYYRRGRRYEPGEVVSIPAGELPSGWRVINGKPQPVAAHAWREIVQGRKEPSDELAGEVERANNELAELEKQRIETERRLGELEAEQVREDGEIAPRRGIVAEEDADVGATENDPTVRAALQSQGEPSRRRGKRAADADL